MNCHHSPNLPQTSLFLKSSPFVPRHSFPSTLWLTVQNHQATGFLPFSGLSMPSRSQPRPFAHPTFCSSHFASSVFSLLTCTFSTRSQSPQLLPQPEVTLLCILTYAKSNFPSRPIQGPHFVWNLSKLLQAGPRYMKCNIPSPTYNDFSTRII